MAWYQFMSQFNGKSCFLFKNWLSSETISLYSDAAGVHGGFAAVFGNKWFSGEWPTDMKDLHITVKELFPIVIAIELWGQALSNHKVLFITDNMAVSNVVCDLLSRFSFQEAHRIAPWLNRLPVSVPQNLLRL